MSLSNKLIFLNKLYHQSWLSILVKQPLHHEWGSWPLLRVSRSRSLRVLVTGPSVLWVCDDPKWLLATTRLKVILFREGRHLTSQEEKTRGPQVTEVCGREIVAEMLFLWSGSWRDNLNWIQFAWISLASVGASSLWGQFGERGWFSQGRITAMGIMWGLQGLGASWPSVGSVQEHCVCNASSFQHGRELRCLPVSRCLLESHPGEKSVSKL